jgi:hypothetical protein
VKKIVDGNILESAKLVATIEAAQPVAVHKYRAKL